jgi:hypothetical protein
VNFMRYAKKIANFNFHLRPLRLTEISWKFRPYRTRLGSTEVRVALRQLKIIDGQFYRVSPSVVTSHRNVITCLSF